MGEVDVPVALVGQEDDPLGIIRCAGESRCAQASLLHVCSELGLFDAAAL